MRFAVVRSGGLTKLAVPAGDELAVLSLLEAGIAGTGLEEVVNWPHDHLQALEAKVRDEGVQVGRDEVTFLPPLGRPPKIICVGLNYVDHTAETGFVQPEYPTLFARFSSSLIGDQEPLVKPVVSDQFDFEGELAVVIGKGGRNISRLDALEHVFGYSLFNDASLRDFQFKSPQWTAGKNFDATGAFGPFLVTADELPAGCKGLILETRLNGEVVQRAPIDDMVFDVATLIEILSSFMTLEPGDLIVSGTPSGVGMARKPPLWMKPGDRVEVEVSQIGILRNAVLSEII